MNPINLDGPYGPAPHAIFIIHEIVTYVVFIVCCLHARRQGRRSLAYLVGGVLFGLLLEYVSVQLRIYSYGQFYWMLGPRPQGFAMPRNIPVCIGMGWGLIMYASHLFSERSGLPVWARPPLEALLALNIDLSVDVVAYRLTMWRWTWGNLPSAQLLSRDWFGVPFGNFFGWLCIVFFYSTFFRLFIGGDKAGSAGRGGWGRARLMSTTVLVVCLAQAFHLAAVHALPRTLRFLYPATFLYLYLFTLITFLALVAVGYMKRGEVKVGGADVSGAAIWIVPVYSHLYFTLWFFARGFYQEGFFLTAFTTANCLLGLWLHLRHVIPKESKMPLGIH